MKYIDQIFLMFQVPLLSAWVITAKDTLSFILATVLSIVTILYVYEKWRVQKLDRSLRRDSRILKKQRKYRKDPFLPARKKV